MTTIVELVSDGLSVPHAEFAVYATDMAEIYNEYIHDKDTIVAYDRKNPQLPGKLQTTAKKVIDAVKSESLVFNRKSKNEKQYGFLDKDLYHTQYNNK